jgi:hypothetical protein
MINLRANFACDGPLVHPATHEEDFRINTVYKSMAQKEEGMGG